ncbi:MAG: hypothetical protein Q8891_14890 [Bacteroidota bacterium]|nr:hypothetical protein [Bacteroidota bacterium]
MKKNILPIFFVGLFLLFCTAPTKAQKSQRPVLVKLPFAFERGVREPMENTPVVFNSHLLLVANYRPSGGSKVDEKNSYLYIDDLRTGEEITRFGLAHSFVSAYVNNSELNVFALDFSESGKVWQSSGIDRFVTSDLKNWKTEKVILPEGDEHLFNSSVCRDDKGFLMAYESNKPVQWCFKFARSNDLSKWEKIPGLVFTGVNHEFSACPAIRYFKPYYYVIYCHDQEKGHNGYTSYLARSKNLINWELSPYSPILEAGEDEGINNSDADIIEYEGRTYIYYATGDQRTWSTIRVAMYNGLMKTFFEDNFPKGVTFTKFSTQQ